MSITDVNYFVCKYYVCISYMWIVLLILTLLFLIFALNFTFKSQDQVPLDQVGGNFISDIPFGPLQTRNQNLEDTI